MSICLWIVIFITYLLNTKQTLNASIKETGFRPPRRGTPKPAEVLAKRVERSEIAARLTAGRRQGPQSTAGPATKNGTNRCLNSIPAACLTGIEIRGSIAPFSRAALSWLRGGLMGPTAAACPDQSP